MQELELRYKDLMTKFSADKILSGSIMKFLAVRSRLRKKMYICKIIYMKIVYELYKANEKVLERFFNGEAFNIRKAS